MTIPKYNKDTKARDGTTLILTANNKRKEMPFEDCSIGDGIFYEGYPHAFFIKLVLSNKVFGQSQFASLLIIDSKKLEIEGEIPFPKDVPTSSVSFVLDAKSNGLIAVEQKLNWLMAIDLTRREDNPKAGRSDALDSSGN